MLQLRKHEMQRRSQSMLLKDNSIPKWLCKISSIEDIGRFAEENIGIHNELEKAFVRNVKI